jgi:hypothetical protein
MAKTAAQKKAAATLKQAQALLAKQKKSLASLENQQTELLRQSAIGITPSALAAQEGGAIGAASIASQLAAAQKNVAQQQEVTDDAFFTKKVGTTGKTQAQLDAAAGAADVVKGINESYSGLGITSKIDPKTGRVITTKTDGTVLTNNTPDSPFTPPAAVIDKPKEISDATKDAFAMLEDLFRSYGLEELAGEIADYMKQGLTSAEALIKLKTNPAGAYATRFAGNFERVKKGLNVLSEAEYINLESSYAQTLKAYGLGSMVSSNRKDNYKKFAEFIAADISAVEFKDRIDLAVTRVKNADPFTRNTLKSFYNINDTDLVSYFLNPTENLPKLQQKVTAAEIGGSAVAQGLTTSLTSALSLAEFGVDKAEAQAGYRYIAQALPRGSFLSDISSQGGPAYTQGFAEDVVLRKSGKALTQQERLIEEETSRFKGSSGMADSRSLASQNRGAF